MRYFSCLFFCILLQWLPSLVKAQMIPSEVSYFGGALTTVSNILIDTQRKCYYIAGTTADTAGIATTGAHKDHLDSVVSSLGFDVPYLDFYNTDIFLTKFDMDGTLMWSTYFGGKGQDFSPFIMLDNDGNIIMRGVTFSKDGIATAGAYQSTKYQDSTMLPFLAKFSNNGEQLWGTYYLNEWAFGSDTLLSVFSISIAIDDSNNIYFANMVEGNWIDPTPGAFQDSCSGIADGSITKFDANGNLIWATYLGGDAEDVVRDVFFAPDGYLYVTGTTNSNNNIATSGTYQSELLHPAALDSSQYTFSFINKFTTSGERIWGTYISSDNTPDSLSPSYSYIELSNIGMDINNNIYIGGKTNVKSHISTENAYQAEMRGGNDFFLMKFDNTGNKIWGTYFGTEGWDSPGGSPIAFNGTSKTLLNTYSGNQIYFIGSTLFSSAIASSCSLSDTGKTFIVRFDGDGQMESVNFYNAYIGSIYLDPTYDSNPLQEIYFTGLADQEGLATPGAFKETMGGLPYSGIFGKLVETCPETVAAPIAYAAGVLSLDTTFTHYTWYHNGVAVAGADEATLNVGADSFGYYYAKFKICACTYYSDTFFFDPLSVEESVPATNQVQLIPNPAKSQVRLSLPADAKDLFMVQVLDPMGRSLWRQDHFPQGTNNLNISVKHFPRGLYYVQVQTQDKVWVQALVVE